MGFDELEPFLEFLRERGYKREKNRSVVAPADDEWWKAVGRVDDHRHYTVVLRIYDHSPHMDKYVFNNRYGVAFVMRMNDRTPVAVESLRIEMDHDGMDVEAFEARCEGLYQAMVAMWPRLPVVEIN